MLLSVLLFQDRFNGMIACKNTLAGTKDYHIVFGEESYTVITEVTTSTFRYELIDAMAESQDGGAAPIFAAARKTGSTALPVSDRRLLF